MMKLAVACGLVLLSSLLAVSSTAEQFDFFYFVQQVRSMCFVILLLGWHMIFPSLNNQ
jgi:hypothetical protein